MTVTAATANAFQLTMLQDALDYHENGDADDAPCCSAAAPCDTRVWVANRLAELSGNPEITLVAEAAPAERPAGGNKPANPVRPPVTNPASERQVAFIKRLAEERDTSGLTTYPARTLAQLLDGQEVSKARASSLIDNLTRQPHKAIATPRPAGPAASEAQLGFLRTLCAEQGEELRSSYTKSEASDEITRLLKARESRGAVAAKPAAAGAKPAAAEPGMYRRNGKIYKVQLAVHGSGRPYAKLLVEADGEWEFRIAPGMQYKLTPADRMTLEEAKEWGALYGTCCVCGRTLTDEKSIAEGIGPKCRGRL